MGNKFSQVGKRRKTVVTDSSHQSNILMLLNQMRDKECLTDLTIVAGNTEVKCHKIVLTAASCTSHTNKPSKPAWMDANQINLTDVKPKVLKQVIDFIYTSNIVINESDIQDLKCIAKKFHLSALEKACDHFHVQQTGDRKSETMNSSRVNPRYQHFFDVNNTKAILSELNEMRKLKILIDAEIQVEGQQFACHRAVLASCSDYFKAMFTNEMNEKHCHHITLNQISADIFESLIEFIYTAQLVLLPDDMQDMLTTVNYFQIHLEKLAETCTSSLLGKLSPSTCLQALNMSVALLSPSLDQAAIQLAVTNFSKVYMTKQFLELSKDHLIKIISDDNLNINEEDTVLHAAVKWINYDKKMRVALINDVMKCVRFPFVNKNYLHEMILSESHIMTSPIVRKCIEESNKPPLESDSHDNTQRYRARDKLTKEVIVMIGSESLCGPSLSVETYSVSTGSWNSLPCLVTGIVPVTVVTLDNDIYVMGYCSDVGLPEVTSQLWKYSSVTNSWSQKPSMKVKRWNYAACVLSGMIYCIGGLSVGKYSMDEVEVYDPITDSWKNGEPLLDSLGSPVAVSDEERSRLFVFNGDMSVDTLQFFLPSHNQWYLLSKYHPPANLGHFKVAFLINQEIHCLGLTDGMLEPNLWILDVSTMLWKHSMQIPFTFNRNVDIVSASSLNGKLYVIMKEYVYDLEGVDVKGMMLDVYDIQTKRWRTLQALHPGCCKRYCKLATFKQFKHCDKLYSDAYM